MPSQMPAILQAVMKGQSKALADAHYPCWHLAPVTGLMNDRSIVTLSCALRTLTPSLRRHHVVLCVNPDGCQLGLRANANGVDLNRNFPAANWKEGETVYRWNSAAEERDVVLLTGDKPGSEPETQALCQLIHRIQPAWVVSFHDRSLQKPHHGLHLRLGQHAGV